MGEKLTKFERLTAEAKRNGIVCASCKLSDELYSDSHGTFCGRCGPSYPLVFGKWLDLAGRAALSLSEGGK